MMDDEDEPTDEISQLEARLDALAERAEQCRKIIMASKAAIAVGALLLVAVISGLFGSGPTLRAGLDRRGAGRHRLAGIERQHLAADHRRHPRRRSAAFGADRRDGSTGGGGRSEEVELSIPSLRGA